MTQLPIKLMLAALCAMMLSACTGTPETSQLSWGNYHVAPVTGTVQAMGPSAGIF